MKYKPLVSVIVTTKNEEKNIENFCKSVKDQSYENIELIVVDNNSNDKTKEIAKKYTDKVFNKGPERSAQRNYAIEKSKGDYLLILDADMILTKDVIFECITECEKNNKIKAIIIPEISIGENFWAKCKAFERHFYYLDQEYNDIEAARFVSKKAFLEINGYDDKLIGGEDWDLSERLYKKYPNRKKIKNYLYHNEGKLSLIKLIKKKFYYIDTASLYLEKNNISIFSPKTLYFLRPSFYKNWTEWFKNPIISFGTIIMLTLETLAGGIGFLLTKLKLR